MAILLGVKVCIFSSNYDTKVYTPASNPLSLPWLSHGPQHSPSKMITSGLLSLLVQDVGFVGSIVKYHSKEVVGML